MTDIWTKLEESYVSFKNSKEALAKARARLHADSKNLNNARKPIREMLGIRREKKTHSPFMVGWPNYISKQPSEIRKLLKILAISAIVVLVSLLLAWTVTSAFVTITFLAFGIIAMLTIPTIVTMLDHKERNLKRSKRQS